VSLNGSAFYCPYCRRKLANLGPGTAVSISRPIAAGEPLRLGEIDAVCTRDTCGQRWALTITLASALEGPILDAATR